LFWVGLDAACASPIFVGSEIVFEHNGIEEYVCLRGAFVFVVDFWRARLQLSMPQSADAFPHSPAPEILAT
jgi:hypothetical protein